ncbi:solute carrier family 15 member 1 isoform X2 [Solenopsis invicta]|uniref:solute carrier family 15 member 1 isoform X2 n=1 Tax=Solenopsis invicta TaxID=13686 RepID=UPI00193E5C8D|nr:solute carrier family 15 member 1 isoform X2 [Solenopsis invicta]
MVVNKMNVRQVRQKPKYPKSVFFIISNEFCERFCFYGMRTVLVLYLRDMLGYTEGTSTIIYHLFTCVAYFFPIFGAILSDSWLGKFYTIFYLSIVYAIGQILLSLSAAGAAALPDAPATEFTMVGLFLIALGTGGIKPCVSAFGGDQFVLPQQEQQLSMFFSLFYFAINTGSLISTILTPVLRETKCWDNKCFFVSFIVPAALMIISIVIFVSGKRLYKIVSPSGNLFVKVSKCICHATYNKIKSKEKRDHWLDHADDTYDTELIEDVKIVFRVLKLFIPLPIFWALYDQQGSQWTFQATRMDGQMGSFVLLPDQLQAINPLLIMIFIPIFETFIYPAFDKIHFINTPLKKLVVGGFLASVAFIVAGVVELQIENTYPILPTDKLAQIRFFNTMDCNVRIDMGKHGRCTVLPLNMTEILDVKANGSVTIDYIADFTECSNKGYDITKKEMRGNITGREKEAWSFALSPSGLQESGYKDMVGKPEGGNPNVRGIIYLAPGLSDSTLTLRKDEKIVVSIPVSSNFSQSELIKIDDPGEYDVYLDDQLLQKEVPFKSGGVYSVVGSHIMHDNKIVGKTITVTPPNSLHMAWMLPQYIIITMAEVMFSVTGLQFAFTQAPLSMKSILTAGWLLSTAVGNIIVVIITGVRPFERQVFVIFLYAGVMAVVMVIFTVLTMFYKYVEIIDEEDIIDEDIPMKGKINSAYKHDEK